ncbi:MAG: L,D-transpeptidase family protein [Rhodocyclaceae bacterium]|nr:L,D-transpeptidase family protein [Rhodocyclaceae bacterium]
MKILSIACLLFASVAFAQPRYSDSGPEPLLARVVEHIEQNQWDKALQQLDALIKAYPNFRLAHLIKGDLLLARARPLKSFGEGGSGLATQDKVADLREEVIARLKAYKNKPATNAIPRYLLQMRSDQKHAVVVDTQKSRLYLYRNDNGTPRFVADYYIAHGKLGTDKLREGDKKTPVGVYHVTASLPRQKLTDFYGSGAFPISYPNEWDKRMGKNGHGIWLHGTPSDTFSRPPKASDGCVVLANQDLDDLSKSLQIGLTPVIISSSIEWLSLDDWQAERASLLKMIDEWRRDWESLDTDRYARHYSKKFQSAEQNLTEWVEHKRKVNAGKSWIKVETRNVSMFRNPGKDEVVVITFEQDYQSSNLSNIMKKRQYWIKEEGRWKIASETAA